MRGRVIVAVAMVLAMITATQLHAAPVTLTASDGGGQSSFNAALNWSNGAAPSAANDYFVTNTRLLRTPEHGGSNGSITFAGGSLTLGDGTSAGLLVLKNLANSTTTINNLIADNGVILNASRSGTSPQTIAGGITIQGGGLSLRGYHGFSTGESTQQIRHLTVTAAISGTGPLSTANQSTTPTANAAFHLTAVNSYTGNTNVAADTLLNLTSTNEQRFAIEDGGVSNVITGAGAAAFDGLFRLDTSALTDTAGVWNLVDVAGLTESWGANFGLAFLGGLAFTSSGGGIYTSGGWTFDQSTGNLTLSSVVVPVPAAMSGGIALLIVAGLAKRRV